VRREFLDELRESYFPDLRGGKAYIDSPRHAAYVDKDTYRGVLMSILRDLGWPALTDWSFEAMKVDGLVAAEAVAGPPTRILHFAGIAGRARPAIPTGFEPVASAFEGSGVARALLSGDVANLVSRQRRKDWHSVRKGACVWIAGGAKALPDRPLSPGERADPGLASVRGLDWLGPNRRREGCIHVHQTDRYTARSARRRSPAQGPLSRRPAKAQGRYSPESRE
jgi:hypothetical protein